MENKRLVGSLVMLEKRFKKENPNYLISYDPQTLLITLYGNSICFKVLLTHMPRRKFTYYISSSTDNSINQAIFKLSWPLHWLQKHHKYIQLDHLPLILSKKQGCQKVIRFAWSSIQDLPMLHIQLHLILLAKHLKNCPSQLE